MSWGGGYNLNWCSAVADGKFFFSCHGSRLWGWILKCVSSILFWEDVLDIGSKDDPTCSMIIVCWMFRRSIPVGTKGILESWWQSACIEGSWQKQTRRRNWRLCTVESQDVVLWCFFRAALVGDLKGIHICWFVFYLRVSFCGICLHIWLLQVLAIGTVTGQTMDKPSNIISNPIVFDILMLAHLSKKRQHVHLVASVNGDPKFGGCLSSWQNGQFGGMPPYFQTQIISWLNTSIGPL